MGAILLAGGAEFQDQMAAADRRAIALTGKKNVNVCILPTAAAPDNNYVRAGAKGIRWFKSLGVTRVRSLPVIDEASSNHLDLAGTLANADMIYLLGGFPDYLEKTLRESRCWTAILKAYQRGAILAGSSAGAMVLCEWFFNPGNGRLQPGLNVLTGMMVVPHHETAGAQWVKTIRRQSPEIMIIGIDEQTGMIRKNETRHWEVYGKGMVTVYHNDTIQRYAANDPSFGLKNAGRI